MIIQKMTHISGFYGNESFCRCGVMWSIRPRPAPCLWLDVTEALHRGFNQTPVWGTGRHGPKFCVGDRMAELTIRQDSFYYVA